MLRVGEAPSGAGEKKERRERSDEQLRRYARTIMQVSMEFGLTEEDEEFLFGLLRTTYGNTKPEGSGGSDAPESEPDEDDSGSSESAPDEGGGEVPGSTPNEGDGEVPGSAPDEGENGEQLKDYSPITLEMARAGNSRIDDLAGIMPTIEARHPDIASVAISFAVQWNTMTESSRIEILSNDYSNVLAGMVNTLESAGLIEVSRVSNKAELEGEGEGEDEGDNTPERKADGSQDNEGEDTPGGEGGDTAGHEGGGSPDNEGEDTPEGEGGNEDEGEGGGGDDEESPEGEGDDEESPEGEGEDSSEGGEEGEDGEDDERYERAGEFINDEDRAFWFEIVKEKDPIDILENPDEYPISVIEGLENEYEADREELGGSLINSGEFGDWYESTGGSMLDLEDMGYKRLYGLRQQFDQRKAVTDQPLVAVSASSEGELERRARQIAEADIEERLKTAKGLRGLLTKLWSGNYGKEFEIRKRQNEIFDLLKEKNDLLLRKEKGEDIDEARLAELEGLVGKDSWAGNSGDTERFVMAHVENMRDMIRREKGEDMRVYGVEYIETNEVELNEDGSPKLDKDGNPIKKRTPRAFRMDRDANGNEVKVPAEGREAEQAIKIEQSIRAYASVVGDIERDSGLAADQKKEQQEGALEQFRREMAALRLEDTKNGGDGSMINNYEMVAMRAAERAKHEVGIDNVMNGFRYIDGEMNRDVNTEAHRNAVEKLVNGINRIPFVPESAAVVTASVIMAVTKSSGNTLGRAAGGLVGGAAVGAVFEGFKYGDRLKSQYATAAREIAMGGRLEGGKLEAEMQENIMTFMTREKEGGGRELITAGLLSSELGSSTDELKTALAAFEADPSNDESRNNLKAAAAKVGDKIADARLRLRIGDQEGVDLMGFSSSDLSKIEGERMGLWKSIAEAQVAINKAESNDNIADGELLNIEQIANQAKGQLDGLVKKGRSEMNSDIRVRAIRHASGAFIRNILIAGTIDDMLANFDPARMSTLENLGIVKTQNNANATNSFFSGFLDKIGAPGFKSEQIIKGATFDNFKDAQQYAKQEHLSKIEKRPNPSKDVTKTVTESDSSYAQRWDKIKPRRWGDNQTAGVYEGNELRLYGDPDSLHIDMQGNSTDWAGNAMNAETIQKAGNMKLLVSFSKDTQMHPVELPIKPDGNVDYSSLTAGELARIKAGDIWCAEVADTSGSTTDVFATMLYGRGGSGFETETITKGYDFVVSGIKKVSDRGVSFNPVSFIGTLRGGNGIGIRRNRSEGTPGGGGAPEGGEGTPGGGGESSEPGPSEGGGETPGGGGEAPDGGGETPEPGPSEGGGETPEPEPSEGGGETPEPEPSEGGGEAPEPTPEGNGEAPGGSGEAPDGGGETPEPEPSEGGGETPEPTPEGGNNGENRPRINPLTLERLNSRGMRPVDVRNIMNRSFEAIRSSLSPEEATELRAAVDEWNTMSTTQWKDLLGRPRENHSLHHRQMLEILERNGLVEANV